MSGGIVNNFAEAIDITIRVKHKNWSKNKTVVDDTLAPSLVDTLNNLGFSVNFELLNVELVNPIAFKDLELKFDD